MSYSEALEHKYALAKWIGSQEGETHFRTMVEQSSFVEGENAEKWRVMFGMQAYETCMYGPCYFVEPKISRMLRSLSANMPDWTLREEAFPTPKGFLWIEESMLMHQDISSMLDEPPRSGLDPTNVPVEMACLVWYRHYIWYPPSMPGYHKIAFDRSEIPSGAETEIWYSIIFFNRYPYAIGNANFSRQVWDSQREGIPSQFFEWQVGKSFMEFANETAHDEIGDATDDELLRFVAALCTFMQDRILVTTQERADRATRKRLEGHSLKPEEEMVHIVVLRRAKSSPQDEDHETQEVDWSCRWLVRGHWRNQFHPSTNTHEPKWIAPYIKGPEDKPVKVPGPAIYSVSR